MMLLALHSASGSDGFSLIAIGFILYCIFSGTGKGKGKKDK